MPQPQRSLEASDHLDILRGAYWRVPPGPDTELVIAYCGVVAQEACAAHGTLLEDLPHTALLAVTSPDLLYQDWTRATRDRADGRESNPSHIERLLRALPSHAALVTVLDGHPATLAWLGSVLGHRVAALGVNHFGQSGDLPDLYRMHRIDEAAVLDAAASLFVAERRS